MHGLLTLKAVKLESVGVHLEEILIGWALANAAPHALPLHV
jgi:hypothetical protein